MPVAVVRLEFTASVTAVVPVFFRQTNWMPSVPGARLPQLIVSELLLYGEVGSLQ